MSKPDISLAVADPTIESAPASESPPRAPRPVNGTLIAGLGLVALFAGWALAVRFLDVPSYILPSPSAVWKALWSGLAVSPSDPLGYYLPLWGTLKNAAIGLAAGGGLGLLLGSLMAESRTIEKLLMPYAFALQSLPKVAIAPLVVIWFGFGDGSKIAIAGLLSFFPILINSFTGLRSVDPEKIDLMRSLSASRFETYRIVKLPNAAPYIFAGLDMAVVYALLGTIVAEFLGAQQGMGVVITQAQAVTDVAGVFAALVILGAFGILLHGIVRGLEQRIVHWGNRGRK
ncbi:NitT/TauT family transport system permease protein [Azospirillum brasilense]|uniref:NitT/TauT family transport system permease protein n=1 Tax=Azospirillum brasilense TaxID=192 RepID=A0A560BBI1_AZOBR|nr:ABC transporter permease [Azospirillum brasilense]TWA69933.1 NitT/TauT family transport system permease protein [Azospirillum brasilense]